MNKIKIFEVEQKFSGTEDFYTFLLKNIKFIGKSMGIKIGKSLKDKPFCVIGKEKFTERNILFFASKSSFQESLEELITLSEEFKADIIMCFISKASSKIHIETFSWFEKLCNSDTQFILRKVDF